MITYLQRSFSTLLVVLLALSTLTTTSPRAAPPAPGPAQTAQETMPDGLMSAFLAASSQPFAAGADGHQARSGGLDFTLRASGLQANGNGLAWGLALSGFGRGEQIAALPEPEIAQTASRLEYRRGALTEWYRDTALGLEQGFTIHQAPSGVGPLVLQLGVSTDLAGTPDADGRGLSFAAPDGEILRYNHLHAWDANGAPLEANLLYAPGRVTLRLNDGAAAYPLTIDPLIYLEQKVILTGAPEDNFGQSVAVSGDTALVGAPYHDVGANEDQGSAYVFIRSGTTWSQQAQLTASDGAAGDQFGRSVALSGDTALVGAWADDVGANANQGSSYVFTRTGGTWTQRKILTADDGAASDAFGWSVALSGDTALVGAAGYGPAMQGAAFVFTGSGPNWTQQGKLVASDGQLEDQFGYSVALSGDTALVGAPYDIVGENIQQGSAYVFTRSWTTWTEKAHLTVSDGAAMDWFGASVALSGDTALVGAPNDDVGGNSDQGSAYVFTGSGTTWSQQWKLTATDGAADDYFGRSVALSGNTALVGAAGFGGALQGSAYVFGRIFSPAILWYQSAHLAASDGAVGDNFGFSVALSGDTALVGAPYDDVSGNTDQGSAYVFTPSPSGWTQQAQLTALEGSAVDWSGFSVALSGDTALVAVPHDDVGGNTNQGSAYVFTRSGTIWSQQAQLIASDGALGDTFGYSVALSGDTALVGAPLDDGGADLCHQGSAYVFTRTGGTWSQQAQLTASDGAAGDQFGRSVALSGDTALVGATGANAGKGAAYAFTRSGDTWNQQWKLTALDGAVYDGFGLSVALSGNAALVGAPDDDVEGKTNQGSAYVFSRTFSPKILWYQSWHLAASDGAAEDYFGSSVALSGDTALVGAPFDDIGTNTDQGSAYIFTPSGGWAHEQKLTASDGAAEDYFGYSVALSGDSSTALVGAIGDDSGANTDQGSAYVFTRSGSDWSQEQKLSASDGAAGDQFGYSGALSGNTALVGAAHDDVDANDDQGSAYFYTLTFLPNKIHLPLALKKTS